MERLIDRRQLLPLHMKSSFLNPSFGFELLVMWCLMSMATFLCYSICNSGDNFTAIYRIPHTVRIVHPKPKTPGTVFNYSANTTYIKIKFYIHCTQWLLFWLPTHRLWILPRARGGVPYWLPRRLNPTLVLHGWSPFLCPYAIIYRGLLCLHVCYHSINCSVISLFVWHASRQQGVSVEKTPSQANSHIEISTCVCTIRPYVCNSSTLNCSALNSWISGTTFPTTKIYKLIPAITKMRQRPIPVRRHNIFRAQDSKSLQSTILFDI